jgi:hypothetical protein
MRGVETQFASSYGAYDALDEEDKQPARVLASGALTGGVPAPGQPPIPPMRSWRAGAPRPTHEHPLVWTHRSGRKSLVLGASADYVVGMDRDEGPGRCWQTCWTGRPLPTRSTATPGRSATPSSGTTRGVLHRAAPYAPDSSARCFGPLCWVDEPIQ